MMMLSLLLQIELITMYLIDMSWLKKLHTALYYLLTCVPTMEPNKHKQKKAVSCLLSQRYNIDLPMMMARITIIVTAMIIFHFKSLYHILLRTSFAPLLNCPAVACKSSTITY